ncbi:unnamed protein product [Paramecium sonneborni]|uniref:Uncharacterized protein n=1 Tax=Paramecium sonneborni TaxID=65129 RepID=A0A8S1LS64_9CILI|nr:unnamed protein product [Paramecium sonneborni]
MNCTHSKPTNQYPIQHHELQQQILHLHQHQKICQNSGKYLEADVAKNKLNQLKKISDVQDKRYLVDKYSEEKDIIDKAHFNEFYQFNTFWDEKMKQFNSEAKDAKDQILSRHQNELTSFLEELDHAIPLKPKDSAQLLKLRKTEQQLAKIEQYKEAHIIQQRILDLQKQEFDKWNITRQNKIKNLISQLRQKQIIELNALQQRILSVQEELSKNKSQELQIMLSKYQHIRKELENQQNQEINRLEKSIKNQSTMSKMNSQMKKTLDENYNLK